jgi:hypothetical protein
MVHEGIRNGGGTAYAARIVVDLNGSSCHRVVGSKGKQQKALPEL